MLGDLYRQGFDIIEEHEDADAIIVNTCGFVEDAKTESIEAIIAASGFKQEGKAKKVIVTGCLAQRYSQELAEQLPEADLVVGFEQYGGLPASIRASLGLETDVDASEYAQRSRVQVILASNMSPPLLMQGGAGPHASVCVHCIAAALSQ